MDFRLTYVQTIPDFDHRDANDVPLPKLMRKAILVECDGHEFHEKTKEQAARDKSRDRDLQAAGFPVYRFTGSEIWRDPVACATQLVVVLQDWTRD